MREVRPTIKVLKALPRDSFDDSTPVDLIANNDWARLHLYGVQHPLLEDARKRFATGVPDRHNKASKAYGAAVYEVRDHGGAGWRGAIVLDDAGDPWLVWAERHDHFHRSVEGYPFGDVMPKAAEYRLRDREEAAATAQAWKRDVLKAFIDALAESVRKGEAVTTRIDGLKTGESASLTVETEHDAPSPDVADAHDGASLLTVTLSIAGGGWGEFQSALTHVCLPFLEPDPSRVEPVFGKDNGLYVCIDITHAQLIQLLADPPPYEAAEPFEVSPPDRLHYVGQDYMLDGYVNGTPLRGVCGVWFVASRTAECGLPVCERCEDERPIAQMVLDMLQSKDESSE
jgi:hypothetical protein